MAEAVKQKPPRISKLQLQPGQIVAGKYVILSLLGAGWEGEVYLIRERLSGIERTAKFFFPHRNVRDRALKFYARKLHKLRQCPVIIQYHTQDSIVCQSYPVSFLISEFVDGELLTDFIRRQPGRRLAPFQAVHLLHALATGIECIHALGEYHGDLHTDNIILQRYGLGFDLKLIDLFHWGAPSKANIYDDVINMIRIFYDSMGGAARYAKHPPEIKAICCGLKRTLILKKFRSAGQIKAYLETMEWN